MIMQLLSSLKLACVCLGTSEALSLLLSRPWCCLAGDEGEPLWFPRWFIEHPLWQSRCVRAGQVVQSLALLICPNGRGHGVQAGPWLVRLFCSRYVVSKLTLDMKHQRMVLCIEMKRRYFVSSILFKKKGLWSLTFCVARNLLFIIVPAVFSLRVNTRQFLAPYFE